MPSKPTAEEFERLHHRKSRSTHAIAAIYNVQQFDVCNWLTEYGIDRPDDANIKDWEEIRLAQKDNTEYALHLTDSLDPLKAILECGYLKPGQGPRWSYTNLASRATSAPASRFADTLRKITTLPPSKPKQEVCTLPKS